jgi:hypothetical protein
MWIITPYIRMLDSDWLIAVIFFFTNSGLCEKYQSRDKKIPEPNGEGTLVSRLVFFANNRPKHYISFLNWFGLTVFNATFNNTSVISWRSVLLSEETGVTGENH